MIEDFEKGKELQYASWDDKEHEGETTKLVHVEEVDKYDSLAILPGDDDCKDEVIDDVGVDDVGVDNGEHGQVSHDHGEPTNVRKSALVPIQ